MHTTAVEVFETKKRALAKGDAAVSDQVAGGKDLLSILCRFNVLSMLSPVDLLSNYYDSASKFEGRRRGTAF